MSGSFDRASLLFRLVSIQRHSIGGMVVDLRDLTTQFRGLETQHRKMAGWIADGFEKVADKFARHCEQVDALLVELGDPGAVLDPVDALVGLARALPSEDLARLRARLESV